jgi:hypothetical protein
MIRRSSRLVAVMALVVVGLVLRRSPTSGRRSTWNRATTKTPIKHRGR